MASVERDDSVVIETGRSYPVWSPDRAFIAAAGLLRALEEIVDETKPADLCGSLELLS